MSEITVLPQILREMINGRLDSDALVRSSTGDLIGKAAPRLPALPFRGFDYAGDISTDGGAHARGCAVASVDLGRMEWAFSCHFLGDPVLPGTLMLEALYQLVGLFGAVIGFEGKGRAAGLKGLRFFEEVVPADGTLEYRIDIRRLSPRSQLIIADGEATAGGRIRMKAEQIMVGFIREPSPA